MLTHRNILFNANISKMLRKPTPQDVIYGVLPMSHIVGFSIILAGTLIGGSAVHIVPKYDPAAFVNAVRDDGISLLFGVPTTYQRLLEYKATNGLNALPRGRLRGLYVAGAPLDPTLKATIEQEFGQPLLNGYGITECAPGISGVRSHAPRADCSVGTILPGVEVRLVGPRRRAGRQRRGRRAACARPQRDARLLPCTGGDRRGDRWRRLVQHRRSRALRRRGAVHRRPHQGADHPVGLQRLSGRGRSGPECAPVGRPVGGRRPRRPRQRGGRGLRAAAARQRHHHRGADGARRPPSDGLQAAERDRRARRPARLVDGQDPEAPPGGCGTQHRRSK